MVKGYLFTIFMSSIASIHLVWSRHSHGLEPPFTSFGAAK